MLRRSTQMVQLRHLAALALLAGCDSAPADSCRSDVDCPGGACVVGQCRSLGIDLGDGDGDASSDLAPGPPPDGAGAADLAARHDGTAPFCTFNGDGVIERSEEPFQVGLGALFAVNQPGATVAVQLAPKNGTWDFSAPVANERKQFDQLLAPAGQWWAAAFPTATFAERIDDGQQLYGVFHVGAKSLDLLGVVSDPGVLTQTELKYDNPIPVLEFPLKQGQSWMASSLARGVASGVPLLSQDDYQFTVDARGKTIVPAGSFDTLRVRMNYTQTIGLLATTRIQYLHVAECFGSVARIRSKDNEPSNDFTEAAEYRRLATQ